MKIKFTVLACLLVASSTVFSQKNPNQILADLLGDGQISEATAYYEQNKPAIDHPFVQEFYQVVTGLYSEQPDSAIGRLPAFLENYYGIYFKEDVLFWLPSIRSNLGDNTNALKILDFVEKIAPNQSDTDATATEIAHLRKQFQIPDMRLDFLNDTTTIEVPIQISPLVIFNALYNDCLLPAIFDTGCGYPVVMAQKTAEKLGLKMIEDYVPMDINGASMTAARGVIDSVQIASLILRNLPVVVLKDGLFLQTCIPDTLTNPDKIKMLTALSEIEIIVGPLVLKLLKHIQLDFQNGRMVINPLHIQDRVLPSNIYIGASSVLYIHTQLNNRDAIGLLDTGGSVEISISQSFYRNYPNTFPNANMDDIKIRNFCGVQSVTTEKYFTTPCTVQLGNKYLDLKEAAVYHDNSISKIVGIKDAWIGLGLLMKFNKVTFDFKAMRLDCE
jgi:hypothetical protein